VTYFNQQTDDKINFSFALGGYENIDQVNSEGVEVFGELALTDWLSARIDYAYIDADDGADGALVLLPKHTGDITLAVDPEGPFSGSVLVRYNGDERSVDGTTLDNWTRVDLTARYALNDAIEIFGRLENVLDEDYQQILGYGTPGFSGNLGVRLRY